MGSVDLTNDKQIKINLLDPSGLSFDDLYSNFDISNLPSLESFPSSLKTLYE